MGRAGRASCSTVPHLCHTPNGLPALPTSSNPLLTPCYSVLMNRLQGMSELAWPVVQKEEPRYKTQIDIKREKHGGWSQQRLGG